MSTARADIIPTIVGANVNAANLPTSATGLPAGTFWNDSGTVKVA